MKINNNTETVVVMPNDKNRKSTVPTDRVATLTTERNRLFIGMMAALLIAFVSVVYAMSVDKQKELKVVWVKMFRDGSWNISAQTANNESEDKVYFKATINNLLSQWVQRRYSEIPYSVRSDYGYCYNFLSPELQTYFLSEKGFNAVKRASEIAECQGCLIKKISIRNIDHYDSDETSSGPIRVSCTGQTYLFRFIQIM